MLAAPMIPSDIDVFLFDAALRHCCRRTLLRYGDYDADLPLFC